MSKQSPLHSYQEWVLPKSGRYKQRNFISQLSFRYPHIPEAPGAAESHLTSMWDTALHFHPRDCPSSLASRSDVPMHHLHVGELQPHRIPQEQLRTADPESKDLLSYTIINHCTNWTQIFHLWGASAGAAALQVARDPMIFWGTVLPWAHSASSSFSPEKGASVSSSIHTYTEQQQVKPQETL